MINEINSLFNSIGPGVGAESGGGAGAQPADANGLPRFGTLDRVIFALTGTPDALLTPQHARERAGRRRSASQGAVQASQSPGEEFMWAPTTGGSGFGINDIIRLFAGGGGGGS